MSLQCNMTLNVNSISSGQAAQATLQVYNPNAVAVVVTGVSITSRVLGDVGINRTTMSPCVAPIGPGMTTSVPALSSINIGPFPIVVASASSSNQFQAVNQTGNLNPLNPQGSQPTPFTVVVGADVTGSDGSFNQAGTAALIVSPQVSPPAGFQGGVLNQGAPNNFITFLAVM